MVSNVAESPYTAFKTQNKTLFSQLAPSMFANDSHNLDWHFVVCSQIGYVARIF